MTASKRLDKESQQHPRSRPEHAALGKCAHERLLLTPSFGRPWQTLMVKGRPTLWDFTSFDRKLHDGDPDPTSHDPG